MPGAVQRAGRVLLALVVFAPAHLALGQAPAPPSPNKAMPTTKEVAEQSVNLTMAQQRFEEMKVELALLSDIDSFPYSLGASYRDGTLELFGFVPDDMTRQNVLEVARRSTSLKVYDHLGIRSDVSSQSAARPAEVLQREGSELLRARLRNRANQMSLQVRADSVVVLTGRVDSMERKLQISRLFRQLPGCAGIDNKLTLEPVVRAGQSLVQVTRDGSLLAPLSAPGSQPDMLAALPPPVKIKQVSFTDKQAPAPAVPQPPMLPVAVNPPPKRSADTKKGELCLPTFLATKQPNKPSTPGAAKIDAEPPALAKLPVKWGRPAENLGTQLKQLQPAHDRRFASKQPLPEPVQLPIPLPPVETKSPSPVAARLQRADLPRVVAPRHVANVPPQPSGADSKTNRANIKPRPSIAAMPTALPPALSWKRPGGEEHSEPRIAIATSGQIAPSKTSPPPQTPLSSLPPLRSQRRWPPAYATGPLPNRGRPGTIVFADNPPAPKAVPVPAPAPVANTRRIAPADLQLRVKSLCGRQASDVAVSIHIDGSLLVRVKVPNRTIEDQLSRKILALPELSSPNVRLLMEIEP